MPNNKKLPEDGDKSASSRTANDLKADVLRMARANKILGALPEKDLEQLAPKLQPIEFKVEEIFHQPLDPIRDVFFPASGIVSLVTLLEDGASVEVAVIGSEGVVGISSVMGAKFGTVEALSQSDGQALKIRATDLREHFDQSPALREPLLQYAHNLLIQVSQNAACNRAHTVEQRLARWLLLTHDRLNGDKFIFTQEFMSRMLGVRRAGVSVAANTLRQAGLIGYSRGSITMLDRKGLEAATCECYRAIESYSV